MENNKEVKNYIDYAKKQEMIDRIIELNMAFDDDRNIVIDRGYKDVIGEILIAKNYLNEDIDINESSMIDTVKIYDKLKTKYEGKNLWKLNDDTKLLEEEYITKRNTMIKWYETKELDIGNIKETIDKITSDMKGEDDGLAEMIGEYLIKGSLKDENMRNNILSMNVSKRKKQGVK